jgi:hypothetical protein
MCRRELVEIFPQNRGEVAGSLSIYSLGCIHRPVLAGTEVKFAGSPNVSEKGGPAICAPVTMRLSGVIEPLAALEAAKEPLPTVESRWQDSVAPWAFAFSRPVCHPEDMAVPGHQSTLRIAAGKQFLRYRAGKGWHRRATDHALKLTSLKAICPCVDGFHQRVPSFPEFADTWQ